MIIILFFFCYLSIFFFIVGDKSLCLFEKLFKKTTKETNSIFFSIIIGLCSVSFLLTCLHFFISINSQLFLVLNGIVFTYFIYNYKYFQIKFNSYYNKFKLLSLGQKGLLFLTTCFIAFLGTDLPIYNLDEGRYHFQALLWVKSYPVVPGLVHLDTRFGTASTWYNMHAFLDCFYLNERSYHILNPYLVTLLIAYCVLNLPNQYSRIQLDTFATSFCLIFLLWPFNYFKYWHLGMTPDLPLHILTIFSFLFLLKQHNKLYDSFTIFNIVFISLTVISFRINGGILILVPCILWLISIYKKKKLLKEHFYTPILVISMFSLIAIRSTILTGWALFPIPIDLFNFDWEIPRSALESMSKGPRYQGLPNAAIVSELDFIPLIKVLLSFFAEEHLKKIGLFTLVPIGGLLLLLTFLIKRNAVKQGYYTISILSLLVFVIWFLFAPLLRFGFGFACVGFSISIATALFYLIPNNIIRFLDKKAIIGLPIIFIAFFALRIIQSLPISVSENKQLYPQKVLGYLYEHSEDFYSLKKVPKATFCSLQLDQNVLINISNCDFSFATKGRMRSYVPECDYTESEPDNETMYKIGDCVGCGGENINSYRQGAGVMNWMHPLPAVGGLCPELEPRGSSLKDGFRIRDRN